jgi:hypothetical protein
MTTSEQHIEQPKSKSILTPKRTIALINLVLVFGIVLSEDYLKTISDNLYYGLMVTFFYATLYYFKPKDPLDSYFLWPCTYPAFIWLAYLLILSNQTLHQESLAGFLTGISLGFLYTLGIHSYLRKKMSERAVE